MILGLLPCWDCSIDPSLVAILGLQVRRRGGVLFVRLVDVNVFYDCSHIEVSEQIKTCWFLLSRIGANSVQLSFVVLLCACMQPEIAGWVRLHPKPGQDAGGGAGEPCGFRECNRRIALDYDFCSIYCQVPDRSSSYLAFLGIYSFLVSRSTSPENEFVQC